MQVQQLTNRTKAVCYGQEHFYYIDLEKEEFQLVETPLFNDLTCSTAFHRTFVAHNKSVAVYDGATKIKNISGSKSYLF